MKRLSELLASKLGSNIFTGVVLLVAASLIGAFVVPSYRQGEPAIAGRRAKDFALDLNGKPAHLSDLRGQVVVLNFWFSSCPPCIAEIDSLNALQRKIAGRGGTVLGVSVDSDLASYERFLRDHHVPFPNYHDTSQKIAWNYGTSVFPETYIIGADGRIARKLIGQQEWDSPDITSYIESLLPISK
jgi:cytochrome c biogenesis protein CcmG/thiol:disulfide interchange protein DsbE